jgi:iron complex outermembrane receptor protein
MHLRDVSSPKRKRGMAKTGNSGHRSAIFIAALVMTFASSEALPQSGPSSAVQPMVDASSVTAPLAAQTPQSSSAAGASQQPAAEPLEEITVTATRRSESIQRVPISIDAIGQNELTESGINDIADLAAVTPGLQYATPNGYLSSITSISIRGMNTDTGASVVGVYLDDTPIQGRLSPLGNVGSPSPLVFDLNRVEVERGPQGTLFGAGSEAGTVRFITNEPNFSEFDGYTHTELASTQNGGPSAEIAAAVGGPIVDDQIAFRVSVSDRHDGGYVNRIDPMTGEVVDSDANTDDKLGVRAALAFKISDDLKITPSLDYQRVLTNDNGRFWGAYSNPSQEQFNTATLLPEIENDHFILPSVKVEARLPFADLTSVTSYLDREANVNTDISAYFGAVGAANYGSPLGPGYPTSPSDVAPTLTGQTIQAITQEIRLASNQPDAFVNWVAGVFYDHRKQKDFQNSTSVVIDPTGACVFCFEQYITDDQIAVFAQGDFHLTQKLTATLGIREADVSTQQLNRNGTGAFNAGEPAVASVSTRETPFTPKAVLSYQADADNMLYASVSKGFRVGGGNAPLANFCDYNAPGSYKSDYDLSYEVGAKDTLLDGRLQVDSSIFHVVWSQIQQVVQLPCGLQYTVNAGSAISNGFDLALQAILADHLKFNLAVGYVNAYFTSNVYEPGSGVPLILAGDKVGLLPQVNAPWNVDPSLTYDIPLPHGDKLELRGDYRYTSRNPGPFMTQIPTSPNYFPLDVPDPPTHLFNGRIGYTQGKVNVALFVDNVFNSRPLLGAYQFSPMTDLTTYSTFRPRTIGLTTDVKF